MSLLAPAGLALLLLLPVVIAIHLWRARHSRRTLSSTLLWARVLSETPLRRPRHLPIRYVLLALQLAVLACGAIALARPAWSASGTGRHLLVAVDTSLAMSATDVHPSRLGQAEQRIRSVIDHLAPADTLTLVDAGTAPRVLATSGDHAVLRRALSLLAPGYGPSTLDEDGALLAGLTAAMGHGAGASPGAHITAYLFAPLGTSPAALDLLRRAVPGLHAEILGTTADDRGVASATVSCAGGRGPSTCEAYAQLVNTAAHPFATRVTATVDGTQLAQRVTLPANGALPIGLALPATARTVQIRLDGHDALPADDTAWAIVPLPVHRTLLLVTPDPASPLAQALRAIPNLTLHVTTPDAYDDSLTRHVDLTVLDNTDDTIAPPGNLLMINPVDGGLLFSAPGAHGTATHATEPVITALDKASPLLRDVDLGSLIISSATPARLPAWAHADIMANTGPLLFSGVTGGRRVAVLLFDPRPTADANPSNLSTLLAFPTLLQNAVQTLAPAAPASALAGQVAAEPVTRQEPVTLRLSAGQPNPGPALTLPSAGDVAALPALRPGLYDVTGDPSAAAQGAAARGATAQPVAVDAAVPGDLSNAPLIQPATTGSAPSLTAPIPVAPVAIAPWEGWSALVMLALVALGAEWWYYVRHT